jgi:DNA-binding NarL/FixJ family response regulator
MAHQHSPTVVAVFNSSEDIIEMLRVALEHEGFVAVTGHIADIVRGDLDVQRFVAQHQPRVVIYDIAPPYERHWRFLLHLRSMPEFKDREFVLTSTHEARVREFARTDQAIHEILGKPYDIEQIVRAVKTATGVSSPTR